MIQGLGRYELLDPETAAKVCELVAKDHWMTLKVMKNQLYINCETIIRFLNADLEG
jgi:hypothetical protein